MCLLSHAEKNLGQSVRNIFNFIFYTWIDIGWHLEFVSTLQEWHLTRFCQNNDPLDVKNYIGRQK